MALLFSIKLINLYLFLIAENFDPEDKNIKMYIFVEKMQVMHGSSDILEIIKVIISIYYLMNSIYPKQISQVMEFSIRYFLQYYPESSRGSKKNI